MMMYHQIKFDCQEINSLEDTVKESYFVHMSSHGDLDLEEQQQQQKKICMTLVYDAASPYQIW